MPMWNNIDIKSNKWKYSLRELFPLNLYKHDKIVVKDS